MVQNALALLFLHKQFSSPLQLLNEHAFKSVLRHCGAERSRLLRDDDVQMAQFLLNARHLGVQVDRPRRPLHNRLVVVLPK